MERMKDVTTVTYKYADDVFVDIVTSNRTTADGEITIYEAYLYRDCYPKYAMYGFDASRISKAAFVKRIEEDIDEYLEIYDRRTEWLDEMPEDWFDDLDDDDDDEDDCHCCEHCDGCDPDGEWIEFPQLFGSEPDVKAAEAIRERFVHWLHDNFKTQYQQSIIAFVKWFVNRQYIAKYWIGYESEMFDMFFVIDLIQEWRTEA